MTVVLDGSRSGMKLTTPIVVVDDSNGGNRQLRRESMVAAAIAVFVNDGHCILKRQWVSRKKPEKVVVWGGEGGVDPIIFDEKSTGP